MMFCGRVLYNITEHIQSQKQLSCLVIGLAPPTILSRSRIGGSKTLAASAPEDWAVNQKEAGRTAGVNIFQAVTKWRETFPEEEGRRRRANLDELPPPGGEEEEFSHRFLEMEEDHSEQMRPLLTSVSSHFAVRWTC